jgi:S1-C subfamily serine protease
LIACPREVGAQCPHCAADIALGDSIMVCQSCGSVHHRGCWKERGGCGSYACTPARRPSLAREPGREGAASGPVLSISQTDLDNAVPLSPAGPRIRYATAGAAALGAPSASSKRRVNRLAIAALAVAIAGIPFFGALTGLAAIVLAVAALVVIRGTPQRGLWLAFSGLLLGLADVIGWVIFLSVILFRPGPDLQFSEQPPDVSVIKDLEPGLQRAMRANVLIERPAGMAALGGKAMGSGVILRIDRGQAIIVTNRHVVDDDFPSSRDDARLSDHLSQLGRLTVKVLGPAEYEGQVVWLAPDQIDLALVRVAIDGSGQSRDANWQQGRAIKVGEQVYAIGNPHRLGWSHTQGVVSQLRTQVFGTRPVRVIQTQAAINPGNSGGGLYDQDGYLIGINSWTADKSVSEGIGFAIALDELLELAPPQLEAKSNDEVKSPLNSEPPASKGQKHRP